MNDFMEKFKQKNSYFLHRKYPDRTDTDNWFHSCEILNRFYQNLSYLICCDFKIKAYSSRQWFQNLYVEIDDSNLKVYVNSPNLDIPVASFPLPLELPEVNQINKEHSVKVDSFISKTLVIEN